MGLLFAAGLGVSPSAAASGTIGLVGYSTPALAYTAIGTAFTTLPVGKGVTIDTSYGPSATQAAGVADGQPADVVNLSMEPDMARLVRAGVVSPRWDTVGPDHGMVTDSVVVFVVRRGNPEHIHSWADLVKRGVRVLTPNPTSSGAGRWNLLAAYEAQRKLGRSGAQAVAYLTRLLGHVVSQPPSASAALAAFSSGTGDVLLDAEADAITARNKGDALSYVVPRQDILIEQPIAVTEGSKDPGAAQAFVGFLESKRGQELWALEGYRPVVPGAARAVGVHFVRPPQLFTIRALGGWDRATVRFFGSAKGIVTGIERRLGGHGPGG